MIASEIKDLWGIYYNHQHLDPRDLTAAIEDQVVRHDLDYRSRLLIRDSVRALRKYWGEERLLAWLHSSPVGREIEAICQEKFDEDRGFSSLTRRVMDTTRPETIEQYLREVADKVQRPLRLEIGGSASLILQGYLSRKTEDIDVVDEVPPEIRSQHGLLHELKERFGLEITHFQRHYLPMGWEQRLHSRSPFGRIQVSLVDVYDVFLSKLYSARTKDRDDLRALVPQLDKATLVHKLKETTASMLAASGLREKAEKNWYILFGESLPT